MSPLRRAGCRCGIRSAQAFPKRRTSCLPNVSLAKSASTRPPMAHRSRPLRRRAARLRHRHVPCSRRRRPRAGVCRGRNARSKTASSPKGKTARHSASLRQEQQTNHRPTRRRSGRKCQNCQRFPILQMLRRPSRGSTCLPRSMAATSSQAMCASMPTRHEASAVSLERSARNAGWRWRLRPGGARTRHWRR